MNSSDTNNNENGAVQINIPIILTEELITFPLTNYSNMLMYLGNISLVSLKKTISKALLVDQRTPNMASRSESREQGKPKATQLPFQKVKKKKKKIPYLLYLSLQ